MKKWIGLLGFVCISAHATDWRVFGHSDTTEFSIDADSIADKGEIREAWTMWNFKEARSNKGDATFPTLRSYQDKYQYNCKDKTLKLTNEIIYAGPNGTGDKRDHSDALKNMQFDKPAAGSIAEGMLSEVCGAILPTTPDTSTKKTPASAAKKTHKK